MFRKPVERLAFEDVVAFLEEDHEENILLDYKRQLVAQSKIAQLTSAFAKTNGGFIIVGVCEQDRHPVRPFDGSGYALDSTKPNR